MSISSYRCFLLRSLNSFKTIQGNLLAQNRHTNAACVVSICTQTGSQEGDPKPRSENDVVNPNFINRNPRNLEQMGLARKQTGWRFHFPSKYYYHKMFFEISGHNILARVEHCSGDTVLSASTKELAIAKHLYSNTDVSAAENIGRVMAQRCRESGITSMVINSEAHSPKSEKFRKFVAALEEGGIEFTEPDPVTPEYEPGINYDNEEEVENLHNRQVMAGKYGELTFLALQARKRQKMAHKKRLGVTASKLERPM